MATVLTNYSVQSTKLSGLLRLINKDDRKVARSKIKKYNGFSSSQCEIDLRWRWENKKCIEFFELKFRKIDDLIELSENSDIKRGDLYNQVNGGG